MDLYPIKFTEVYKQYIWGGQGLERLGKTVPDSNAAESWEIACHKDGMSIVSNGSLQGKSIKELVTYYKEKLFGTRVQLVNNEFPLLVKFINAKDRLSVQVHPNDNYALENENQLGKNEAWVILDAEENAELIIGLKHNINKKAFEKAIKQDKIGECLDRISVRPGDVINIPAGLIHAIGKGIILAEIQQNSNITYRLYDYNRTDNKGNKRPLHIEKALDVIDFSLVDNDKKAKGICVDLGGNSIKKVYVANKYFCIETYDISSELNQVASGETFFIYIFTDGEGHINYKNGEIKVRKGESYLIPASLGNYSITGSIKFIKSYVPDIDGDIINPLKNEGISIEEIYNNIDGVKDFIMSNEKQ